MSKNVETFETLEFVNSLIQNYTKLMHRAMDENCEQKAKKFNESIRSLSILKNRLEREN